ncbi:MAG: RNA polymerase sigma factor [bacterium ADurb.Bin236]|nr:MAG: RNA polymerase sigma factor [bacterium ADurb.Bin236]HOY63861.1 sigma-70 family RNA polymerase sigma factor [bacterium]
MKNSYEGLDDRIVKTVLIKAKQLIGKAGYTSEDYDDIVQEMILDIYCRLSKYDPARSTFKTFINRIVEMKCADMLQAGHAANNDLNRRAESLNLIVEQEDGAQLECIQTVSVEELPWNNGAVFAAESDLSDFKIDLQKIMSRLSPRNRTLCERLTREHISEICRDSGISRTAQYDHIRQIRKKLQEAGFEIYLGHPPVIFPGLPVSEK